MLSHKRIGASTGSYLKGLSGMKSFIEQLNISASWLRWFKLYLVGDFELSAWPIKPLDTFNLTASSD